MGWKSASLALAILLVGCQRDAAAPPSMEQAQSAASVADQERGLASGEAYGGAPSDAPPPPAPVAAPDAQPTQPQPGMAAPVMYLAYAYQIGLKLPGNRLTGVMDAHIRACQQAGPRLCQLVSSNRSGDPESYLTGSIQVRGEPGWLRSFMGGLERQADQAGGHVVSQATTTEDLTRSIVDIEAQLRAKRTLRDRLQQLLATRPGRLSDLLEAERALAQVQGEIDSVQSELAVMRTRVSMSELTLNYESSAEPLRSDLFEPLTEAFANFAGWIVKGLASIVTLVAVALPWALIAALGLWLSRKWRARRRGLFWRHRSETPPPANS